LKCSTSNCGSKPTDNKKNDRISQTPSRNMKNKVEVQPRKVNKKNRMVEPIHDVDVKYSLLNANSICATCKKSMFDGIHDMCHVFTEVGLKWKPTGRTFTIVGNSCPLTRITSANVVPPKKTTSHSVETQKPELKVYIRKPKNVKNVGLSKKAKIVESKNANHSEPNHPWGSNATDIPSSSSLVMTGCPDCSLVQLDSGMTILQELWGMFCDADLEVVFQKTLALFDKKLDLSFFHVFGALCYPTNNNDDLGKLDAKANIGIFVGYTPAKKAFKIYNKRTQKIIETIHVTFDELTAMASEQFSSGPGLHSMTPVQVATAPRAVVLADSPVLTSIDQDAPSTTNVIRGPLLDVCPLYEKATPNWRIVRYFFDAFLTSVEPKKFKQAMTEPSWIDAIQEEIHEFEMLQNKARLVAKINARKESDFEESFAPLPRIEAILSRSKRPLKKEYDDLPKWTQNDFLKCKLKEEMSFFLGLQISQSPRGIFINQSKYAFEIVKKYGLLTTDFVDIPLVEKSKLDEDLHGKQVDATLYRGMIGTINMGLWYSKDTDMSRTAYADADHARCQDTRRSTSGSAQFLGDKLVSWSSKKQKSTAFSSTEAEYIALSGCYA
ncbi:retrovirus-related pol polyprotein from transposon TNT 1-94, partial [Tanacetum coccineum]